MVMSRMRSPIDRIIGVPRIAAPGLAHRSFHGLDDAGDRWHPLVLRRLRRRQWHMRRGDADDWTIEVVEALLGRDGRDLSSPATQARILLDGEKAAGLAHLAQDSAGVEGDEASDVDNCGVD